IIKDERIARFEPGKLLIDLQPLTEPAALGVMISQKLQCFHVFRIPPDDALHELYFYIQIARLGTRHFFSGTAFLRHTTVPIVSKSHAQVKDMLDARYSIL